MRVTIREAGRHEKPPFHVEITFDGGPPFQSAVFDPFTNPRDEQRLEWYYEQWLAFPFTRQEEARQAAASVTTYGERLFQQLFTLNPNPKAYAKYQAHFEHGGGFGDLMGAATRAAAPLGPRKTMGAVTWPPDI